MRYLPFSLLIFLASCGSDYKVLRSIPPDPACIKKARPQGLTTAWYDAAIDVVGKHISGLLLIKPMADQSQRVVFTNEAGVTFLDFAFHADGTFMVKHIIKQLNKKPVVEVLRKDFELLLGLPFRGDAYEAWEGENEVFYGVRQKSETAYFITGMDCGSLRRLESGSRRKRKVSVVFSGDNLRAPDAVLIKHHTFNMVMNLKKLERQ